MSMTTMEDMTAELQGLIEREIPEGRQQMESSYANLERVAAFCEANYHQSDHKAAALAETQRYTVQSLASVAYQINTLASNFLAMLDLQADKIAEMESQVENISMIVDSHKEKVARREIGSLTANKVAARPHKIVAPAVAEKPSRYVRRPIDFSLFDELGHGVKLSSAPAPLGTLSRGPAQTRLGRTASNVSGGSSGSAASAQHWMDPRFHQPPAAFSHQGGPTVAGGRGSLSKGSAAAYRPPAVAQPPQAPEYGRYSDSSRVSSSTIASSHNSYAAVAVPPAPPMGGLGVRQSSAYGAGQRLSATEEAFPAPPSPGYMDSYDGQHSPPLPPPPMMDEGDGGGVYGSYMAASSALPDWVPSAYIEKVVAIYDYQAEKPDELSFIENSVIYVLKKNDDGWYEGVLDGMTGLFPGNYVESASRM